MDVDNIQTHVWHVAAKQIATFLAAEDLVNYAIANKACAQACSENDVWKQRLADDFKFVEMQRNRSQGYYRRLYLSLLEDRLAEDNLITGGH